MKTDLAHMTKIYRAYLDERKIEAGAGCPAPEDIVRLVTQGASRKARASLLAHVASCGDCARVLQSVLRLSREIARLTIGPEALQSCAQDEVAKKDRVRLVLTRKAAVAIMVGLIGLTVVTFSVIKLSDRPTVRGTTGLQIKLISPKQGASLVAEEIKFKWEAIPKAARYTVELFNKFLEKIWQSGPTPEAQMALQTEARSVVLKGEIHFWRVTAALDDGSEMVSTLGEFSIRR